MSYSDERLMRHAEAAKCLSEAGALLDRVLTQHPALTAKALFSAFEYYLVAYSRERKTYYQYTDPIGYGSGKYNYLKDMGVHDALG